MRRPLIAALVLAFACSSVPLHAAFAQSKDDPDQSAKDKKKKEDEWGDKQAPLPQLRNAGPCPYVKVLYDAGRVVEFKDDKESLAQVAYTGEIDGVSSDCAYKADEPIQVAVNVLFALGRGPQAQSPDKNYRYWIAVTDRNRSVINKEFFDLRVRFPDGKDRAYATEIIKDIEIPRSSASVAGNNFEILVGFDVTPKQAEFNVEGKRFHINAVSSADASAAPKQ
jgi:hypothetical protein